MGSDCEPWEGRGDKWRGGGEGESHRIGRTRDTAREPRGLSQNEGLSRR